MMFSRSKTFLVCVGVCAALTASLYFVQPSVTATEECDAECRKTLASIRGATAKYQREDVAIADGYAPDPVCVSSPDGAMGIHYVKPQLVMNPSVDPTAPEVLLYTELPNGKRKLVGVEYLVPVIVDGEPWFGPGPPPAGEFNPAPTLGGQTFDGPMPGHNPFMPWHYDLHVWVWSNNPSGMFAPWNPAVSCPASE
jgi:hypothetical protein